MLIYQPTRINLSLNPNFSVSPLLLPRTKQTAQLLSSPSPLFLLSSRSSTGGRRQLSSQKMTTNPKAEEHSRGTENEQEAKPVGVGWVQKIEEQYRKTKKHAETYPYVWASYILVYGGFGLWFSYRWRALRKTEDRVRVLQEKLRKQNEEASNSAEVAERSVKYGSSTPKPPSAAADKVNK